MNKFALLLSLLLFNSCDSSTGNDPDQIQKNKVPGIGSTYIENDHTLFDSLKTGTVADVNFARLGRENVTRIAFGTASFYISYESNGDVSFANDYSKWWITLPTTSNKEIRMPADTSNIGAGEYYITNTTAVRKGTEKLKIAQKEHTAIIVEVQYRGKRYNAADTFLDNSVSNISYWWIPEIGYFGRYRIDQFEPTEAEMQYDLFDYLLRD